MVDRAYDRKFFAEWLKDARRDQHLDEEQIAELLGVSVGSYLVWEVGNTQRMYTVLSGVNPAARRLCQADSTRADTAGSASVSVCGL